MPERRWSDVKDVFHEALRRDGREREQYLEATCGDDIDLRIEVESLLISLNEASTFLEMPVMGEPLTADHRWQLENGRLISHYKVVSPIAVGGMGEVYLAEDQKLRRRVALKILPEHLLGDRDRLKRFQREAEVVSALNHPNILTIYDFGVEDGIHLFASEFVEGVTLRERLRSGPMAVEECVDIAAQIASALEAAHKAGVVHRDIKPENVMIREDGYVKVLDFGLAKLTESPAVGGDGFATPHQFLSQPGLIMGTVAYMSPEQTRGRMIDARTDFFSLGVVLFEMLAGRTPFTGDTTSDVVASIIQTDPEAVSKYNPDVPPELDAIVKRALEKDRMDRYPTATRFAEDLKKVKKQLENSNSSAAGVGHKKAEEQDTETRFATARPTAVEGGNRKFILRAAIIAAIAVFGAAIYWFYFATNVSQEPITGSPNTNAAARPAQYWEMSESERMEFVRQRSLVVAKLIGDDASELDETALGSIRSELDAYARRRDSLSQEPLREGLRVIYGRGSQFAPVVAKAFEAKKLSPVLGIYQAMIESEYHDCLRTATGPIGLFQFSRATAEKYGLTRADECNVERQSDAAARYMSDLTSDFGQGSTNATLALLAFNLGEDGSRELLRNIRQQGETERSFWAIARHEKYRSLLTDSSRVYVPRFFAAAIIGETPGAFGLLTPPLSEIGDGPS